jgi:hypothetical protein
MVGNLKNSLEYFDFLKNQNSTIRNANQKVFVFDED